MTRSAVGLGGDGRGASTTLARMDTADDRPRGLGSRLDDAVFKVEAGLALLLLAAMTLVVFVDVVHRVAANQGPLERTVAAFLPPDAVGPTSLALSLVLALAAFFTAAKTTSRAVPLPDATCAGIAVAATASGYGLVKLLLWLVPNGLVWSQKFGLTGMLWVGMLGASMAAFARAHLTLEVMDFVWKGAAKTRVVRAGLLMAAGFCAVMAALSILKLRFEYDNWQESEHLGGLIEGLELPNFLAFGILPVSFTVMAVRFSLYALSAQPERKPALVADAGVQPVEAEPS